MDQNMKKLEDIIFKEKYTIKPTHLVSLFDLHIKQAKCLLESFANKHQKDLVVKFGLTGYQSEPNDEIGARRFIVVESDDVEDEKKKFTKLISCSIRSIKEKHNSLNIDYPINNFVSNKTDLINYQKKGYCVNEKIDFRKDKLELLLKKLGVNGKENKIEQLNGKLIKPANVLAAKEVVSTLKSPLKSPIKAIKPEQSQNTLLASFKKAKPKVKEIKQEVKITKEEDDKSNDKEEDDKSNDKEDLSKDGLDDLDDWDNDIDMDEEEEKINKKSNNKQMKRSETFDSDSSEDFIKENLKHKNKKQRKRVIEFDDSSDESNDNKNGFIENKFVTKSTTKSVEEVSSKLVEQQETYIDEDGYKMTRTIKKVVKDESKPIDKPIIKNENKSWNKPAIKNENKFVPSPTETKKPIAKQASKNQLSIMSFFKPKNALK